jgi:LmbE family N-acetylglucosaminyl deacetylase
MVVLAIGAHPDDIEFGCYATLAKMRNVHSIHFIVFSAGEISGDRETRIKEAKASAEMIDAKLEILRYPDGNIPLSSSVVKQLTSKIEDINPEVVFTPCANDSHQDHRAVSKITVSASRSVGKVLFYELPQTYADFAPNLFVDVTQYFSLKEKALQCFKTQANKSYLDLEEIKGLARYRAYQCYRRNCLFEAFRVFRVIEI